MSPPSRAVQVQDEAGAVVTLIEMAKFRYQRETELHRGLMMLFNAAGMPAIPEVMLSATERIDFLVRSEIARVGVEVKVKGSTPRVQAQLARYAATGAVDALVLVTARAKHRRLEGLALDGPGVGTNPPALDEADFLERTGRLFPVVVPVLLAKIPWM